jgi:hypothetical protein
MLSVKERLTEIKGVDWSWTCCGPTQEPTFRALLERAAPRVVLEIGTHQGVSAALLAEYASRVITIDIVPNPARAEAWALMECAGRIEEFVFQKQAARDVKIVEAAQEADLAFIDGGHLMRDIAHDFGLVSPHCKRMILHDYWMGGSWPDVKEFVDGLDPERYAVEIHRPFVYVEVKS